MPRHVAIIMDGNGRWAKQRLLPRVAGHRKGVETVRAVIRGAIERRIEYLTLFAFSSENWRRPPEEVSILMELFLRALEQEVAKLHQNGIRFRVVGDLSRFTPRIRELIAAGELLTSSNTRLTLTIAARLVRPCRRDTRRACSGYTTIPSAIAQKIGCRKLWMSHRKASVTATSRATKNARSM